MLIKGNVLFTQSEAVVGELIIHNTHVLYHSFLTIVITRILNEDWEVYMNHNDSASIHDCSRTRRVVTIGLWNTCRVHFLLVLFALLLLPGATLGAVDQVPFEWDSSFVSPGTSLSIKVEGVMGQPPKGAVMISIKSSGFDDSGSHAVLWIKNSAKYDKYEPALSEDGTVQIIPGVDIMMLGGYLRGQSLDIALVDEGSNRRAQAKITPFPIEAQGNGECKATAEVITETGLVWIISFIGYESGETVKTTSATRKETLSQEIDATAEGRVTLPILYPRRSKGKAKVQAVGSKGCSVTIEYAIGKSARKAK